MIVCCCIKAASLSSAQTNHATYTFNARTMHVRASSISNARTMHVRASSISFIKKLPTSDHWLLFLWNHVKPRHFFCFSLSILGTNYILTIRFGIPTVLHTTHHLQFVHRAIMSTKLKLAFNILEVHRASLLLAGWTVFVDRFLGFQIAILEAGRPGPCLAILEF